MLILNKNNKHSTVINKILHESTECYFIVAFLKNSGLNEIIPDIYERMKLKKETSLIIGLDLFVTEPDALYRLLRMQSDNNHIHLYLFKSEHSTFHPKIYAGRSEKITHILTGSANITAGGLTTNNEASIYLNDDKTFDAVKNYFDEIISDTKSCEIASFFRIKEYEDEYNNYKKHVDTATEKAKSSYNQTPRKSRLIELYSEYLKNTDQMTDLASKRANYKQALKTLRNLNHNNIKSQDHFLSEYEKLVGAKKINQLWHSGGINRSKSMVAQDYLKFIDLIEYLLEPSSTIPPVNIVFLKSIPYVKQVKGLAFNVLTEILNTLNSEKFPVLNKNPLGSIFYLFGKKFKTPSTFKPIDYLNYSKFMTSIKNDTKAKDLTEVDHFLNYVYWHYAKNNITKT